MTTRSERLGSDFPSHVRRDFLVFPVALWWLATLFFWGRWGKYLDDYVFGLRDPVTGGVDFSASPFRDYFWRPLHLVATHALQTAFWNHPWVLHLLAAVVHGGVALALWLLLRRLTADGRFAALPPLLFLAAPLHSEVVFWPSALSTAVATGLCLAVFFTVVRYAERGGARAAFGAAALAFLIPCFNEQPAAGIAALPVLDLALRPPGEPPVQRLRRAFFPFLLCIAALTVYVSLLIGTAPPHVRGGSRSLVGLSDVPAKFSDFAADLDRLVSHKAIVMTGDGFRAGWQALASPLGALAFAALAATAGLWLRGWLREGAGQRDSGTVAPGNPPARRVWALLFAATWFAAAWAPIILVKNQTISSRVLYFAGAGLAVLLGVILDLLADAAARLRLRAVYRPLVGLTCVALALLGAVAMVGRQVAFRERSRADLEQAGRLKAAIPAPPPQTVFVPLNDGYRPAQKDLLGWLRFSWSATALLQQTYRRDDVFATSVHPRGGPMLSDLDQKGARYPRNVAGLEPDPKRGARIRWSQMVPFVVNRKGGLVLARRVVVVRPGEEDLVVDFPVVNRRQGKLPTAAFVIDATSEPPTVRRFR